MKPNKNHIAQKIVLRYTLFKVRQTYNRVVNKRCFFFLFELKIEIGNLLSI